MSLLHNYGYKCNLEDNQWYWTLTEKNNYIEYVGLSRYYLSDAICFDDKLTVDQKRRICGLLINDFEENDYYNEENASQGIFIRQCFKILD